MRVSVISFTGNGKRISERLAALLEKEFEIRLYTKWKAAFNDKVHSDVLFVESSVGNWAEERMREQDALLFIGACGIAVRAVAPFLTDKLHDVPVLVMDEQGKYVVPIVAGHMGGANTIANGIAEKTGAVPVITTATDINQKFAVDLFAKRNNLYIVNKDGIAEVSAKALEDKEILISIETGHETSCRETGVRLVPYPPKEFVDVVVTSKEDVFDAAICLKPKEYVVGIGCKKGKSATELDSFLSQKIQETGLSMTQILRRRPFRKNRRNRELLHGVEDKGIPFLTYTAEELQAVDGDFTGLFVRKQVGVANVCERAAVKACGDNGKLAVPKIAGNGMTIAIARREWKVRFDDE